MPNKGRCTKCGGILLRGEETCLTCGKPIHAHLPSVERVLTPSFGAADPQPIVTNKPKPIDPHIHFVICPAGRMRRSLH